MLNKFIDLIINDGKSTVEQNGLLKVRANLKNGIAEFYSGHQPLHGRIQNDFLQAFSESGNVVASFVLDNAILSVDQDDSKNATVIRVTTANYFEINSSLNLQQIKKDFEEEKKKFNQALENFENFKKGDNVKASEVQLRQQLLFQQDNQLKYKESIVYCCEMVSKQ